MVEVDDGYQKQKRQTCQILEEKKVEMVFELKNINFVHFKKLHNII